MKLNVTVVPGCLMTKNQTAPDLATVVIAHVLSVCPSVLINNHYIETKHRILPRFQVDRIQY